MRSNPNAVRLPLIVLALSVVVTACTGTGSPGLPADALSGAHTGAPSSAHPPGHIAPAAEDAAEPRFPGAVILPAAVAETPLPRTGWTASASDEETARENGRAANVLDGSLTTIWHSRWSGTPAPLPHAITIDMHATRTVAALRYTPRTDFATGRIGRFEIHVSTDGTSWGTPIASGTWADDAVEKTAQFAPVSARFVRLTGLTEAKNRGPWSSAAELNLFGEAQTTTTPPPPPDPVPPAATLPRTGWVVTASDQETARENGRAINLIDGNAATIWHSQYSPTLIRLPHTVVIDLRGAHELSGLRYLPRQGTPRNGTIGGYSIAVSANGTAWSAPVATGTWADTAAEKTVTFPPVQARYLRLTATTEAGNRGSWSTGAELNLLGRVLSEPPPAPPTPSKGAWGSTITFPLVPAAAALLPGNKLLTWSAYTANNYGGANGRTQTAILDLNTGMVTPLQVSNTLHDMFCPGVSMLKDGRILVSGGSNSSASSIYDPVRNTWSVAAPMKIPRAYQSNVTLSTGEVFSIGGSWAGGRGGKHGEVWSEAAGWRRVTNASVTPILTADPEGVFRSDNHAWLFAGPGGTVFHAGPSKQMNTYTTAGTGSVQSAGLRGDSPDAMNGNAVMYDVGKILTVGGAPAYQNSDATARAYALDITNGVKVTRTGDMAARRAFSSGVALPDGQVLVVGGQAYAKPFSDATAALAPELWNPASGRFTALAPMAVPRTYHSFALLLPDARVFVGGGGLCGACSTNHPNGQIFTPPYLLNGDGTARPRPAIVQAPTTAALGATISVTTSAPISSFSLIRMSTVTHTVNTDQRRIPLTATSVTGTTATLRVPSDPGVAVPGDYLLFALDANGVPSVSTTIRIG
jgi:galactose oxidase